MKYLLLFGVLGIAWWLWRKRNAELRSGPPAAPVRPAEKMVACAHCGVHMPLSESLSDGARHFCCDEHRRAAGGGRN